MPIWKLHISQVGTLSEPGKHLACRLVLPMPWWCTLLVDVQFPQRHGLLLYLRTGWEVPYILAYNAIARITRPPYFELKIVPQMHFPHITRPANFGQCSSGETHVICIYICSYTFVRLLPRVTCARITCKVRKIVFCAGRGLVPLVDARWCTKSNSLWGTAICRRQIELTW